MAPLRPTLARWKIGCKNYMGCIFCKFGQYNIVNAFHKIYRHTHTSEPSWQNSADVDRKNYMSLIFIITANWSIYTKFHFLSFYQKSAKASQITFTTPPSIANATKCFFALITLWV